MAFNLGARFPRNPDYYKLLDPGSYQYEDKNKIQENKFAFLSKTPRVTQPGRTIWTHALYDVDMPPKIPNCTSMVSKTPRFPYEAFSEKDLEELLCKCGLQMPCECPPDNVEPVEEVQCQAKTRRCLFKGPPPRVVGGEGLSTPSKGDRGFAINSDGSKKRIRHIVVDESPPFYDARVNESTAFYQGWKWSKWTSKRSVKSGEQRPGPADYDLERKLTDSEICAERVRAFKRKTSKQYRFIEMVQRQNILEGRPGPATYSPTLPIYTELQYLGPKGERFPTSKYGEIPGPTEYWLRRDFDPPEIPKKPCHAKLPAPACFGVKDSRFKPRREEGPSPATYNVKYKPCKIVHCPSTPFGSSVPRFKENAMEESDEEEIVDDNESQEVNTNEACPTPTWGFRSKTIRMKPLLKKFDEPSPADLPMSRIKIERLPQLQYEAPFFSSEGRFQPWYNWIPVLGKLKTPGPCYYNLERPRCNPAYYQGPLYRTPRFASNSTLTPAPNEYNIGGGVETVLATHNETLKKNMANQHKFVWKPKIEPRQLTLEEKEALILNKCISLLEIRDETGKGRNKTPSNAVDTENKKKQKLLRYFLYRHAIPVCN